MDFLVTPQDFDTKDLLYTFQLSVPPKLSPLPDLSEPLFMDEFFQIYCSVLHGDFPISFKWLHRNETIVGSENVRIEFTKRSSILSIESVNGEDAGVYTCVASNRAGATNLSTTLIVKGYQMSFFRLKLFKVIIS